MAKLVTVYICQNCSFKAHKWVGKCPECNQWNTLIEEIEQVGKSKIEKTATRNSKAQILSEIDEIKYERMITGINEFDRVVGGGIVPGSLALIGGEPGIGKSTLLTLLAAQLSKQGNSVLYVSGEESSSQVAGRVRRLGFSNSTMLILNENRWETIKTTIETKKANFIIVDSIQTTITENLDSAPGTVSQIREVTFEIMNYCKSNCITAFVIGHITKEGNIAGPKILEHMVDTVIYFEGDQFGHYRMLRAIKNRFGSTNEVGIFEMSDRGLLEVENPSQYFIDESLKDSFGRSVTCVEEGSRSLFVEVQSLVVDNKFGNGRRTTQGFDNNRLAMLIAVVEKYLDIPLSFNDVYVNIVGGIKLSGRESDLAIIASLVSSYQGKTIPSDTVFIGEVGLTGEVRSVPRIEARLKEIGQLNYKKVVTNIKNISDLRCDPKIEIININRAKDLIKLLHT